MFFLKKKSKKGRRRRKRPGATRLGSSRKGLCANPFFLKKNCCLPHCFFFLKKRQTTHHLIFLKFQPLWCPKETRSIFFRHKNLFSTYFWLKTHRKEFKYLYSPINCHKKKLKRPRKNSKSTWNQNLFMSFFIFFYDSFSSL